MKFPHVRLRRLRENALLRRFVSETKLRVEDLVQPLFVKEGLRAPAEIASMPGQYQHTEASVLAEAKKLEALGVPALILFGIPAKKDHSGRAAYQAGGITQKTIARIKKQCKKILVIADVCLCEYLSHGHCGVVAAKKDFLIDNDRTLEILAKTAVSYAGAGADVVAPSDMMDGRVRSIRAALDKNHFKKIPILSYSVKYASAFYGPFREAAESAPTFGDRKSYQMDFANSNEAVREAKLDVQEGADMLLVKPAMAYGDIIRRLKEEVACPVGAYSVSGEYSMIKAAAAKGWVDEKKIVIETHVGMKRAGADFILTYWAKQMALWADKKGKIE